MRNRALVGPVIVLLILVSGFCFYQAATMPPAPDQRSGRDRKWPDERHDPLGPPEWKVWSAWGGESGVSYPGDVIYQDGTRLPIDGFESRPVTDWDAGQTLWTADKAALVNIDRDDFPVILWGNTGFLDHTHQIVRRVRDGKLLSGTRQALVLRFQMESDQVTMKQWLDDGTTRFVKMPERPKRVMPRAEEP